MLCLVSLSLDNRPALVCRSERRLVFDSGVIGTCLGGGLRRSGPLPGLVLSGSWVRVPGCDRSRWRVAPRRRSRPGRFSGWAAQAKENHVEREEDVPQLDGRAEA